MTEKITYRDESVTLENAKILFRNLSGRPGQYTSEGDRSFHVVLTPEQARDLTARNWRVKQLKPREDGEPGDFHLKVKVNYKTGRPPRIIMLSSKGRTELGAEEANIIDALDLEKTDMVLNGWYSDMSGGGFSAFLKTLVVKIREDDLELMYAGIPEASAVRPSPDEEWSE